MPKELTETQPSLDVGRAPASGIEKVDEIDADDPDDAEGVIKKVGARGGRKAYCIA